MFQTTNQLKNYGNKNGLKLSQADRDPLRNQPSLLYSKSLTSVQRGFATSSESSDHGVAGQKCCHRIFKQWDLGDIDY